MFSCLVPFTKFLLLCIVHIFIYNSLYFFCSALCGFLILLCLIGTIVDYLDETFSISSLTKHENTISMVNTSLPDEAMDVNGLDPTNSLTAEDVILLNRSASFPIKVHYIISTFKGTK